MGIPAIKWNLFFFFLWESYLTAQVYTVPFKQQFFFNSRNQGKILQLVPFAVTYKLNINNKPPHTLQFSMASFVGEMLPGKVVQRFILVTRVYLQSFMNFVCRKTKFFEHRHHIQIWSGLYRKLKTIIFNFAGQQVPFLRWFISSLTSFWVTCRAC